MFGNPAPEDMGDLIRAFQGAVAAAVRRFDGHVAKLMGDGALVYFGYPRAHENDAERAARAALGLVDAVRALRLERAVALEVRAGIATGLLPAGPSLCLPMEVLSKSHGPRRADTLASRFSLAHPRSSVQSRALDHPSPSWLAPTVTAATPPRRCGKPATIGGPASRKHPSRKSARLPPRPPSF